MYRLCPFMSIGVFNNEYMCQVMKMKVMWAWMSVWECICVYVWVYQCHPSNERYKNEGRLVGFHRERERREMLRAGCND